MPIPLRLTSSAFGTLNTGQGQGGGAFLMTANMLSPPSNAAVSTRTLQRPAVSTADYYHVDGITDFAPWDLLAWGSPGAAIAAAKGFRYLWVFNNDHGSNPSTAEGGWEADAGNTYAGFSNDPHIPPDASTLQVLKTRDSTIGSQTAVQGFGAWMVYNPDDPTNPFYMYCEGGGADPSFPNALPGVCYKTSNFDTPFTGVSMSHPTTNTFGLTAYQRVYRLGTGNWISFGGGNPAANDGTISKWTSTDGVNFTNGSLVKKEVNSSGVAVTGAVSNGWQKAFSWMSGRFQIGSDWYQACKEDLRGPNWSSGTSYSTNEQVAYANRTFKSLVNSNLNNIPTFSPGQWQDLGVLGQYVSLVPVDGTTGDIIISGTPPIIRISNRYDGVFPTASYLQYVHSYQEDGICHIYANHGFAADVGVSVSGALPEDGGGLNEQFIDLYSYVYDATAAQASAPCAVRASCNSGTVTLSWADLPSGRSYRIKRGTDGVTFGTTVSSSVTGTTITDSPTAGSVYYYQVISLNAGVEQASRIVSTYVS